MCKGIEEKVRVGLKLVSGLCLSVYVKVVSVKGIYYLNWLIRYNTLQSWWPDKHATLNMSITVGQITQIF